MDDKVYSFTDTRRCDKCGSSGCGFNVLYVKGRHSSNPASTVEEHIIKTCKVCGFEWRERPFDYKD